MKRILLPLILLLACHLPSIGQIDKEFWFVAPEIAQSHGDSPIYMRVSTMEDTAQIMLRLPADLSFVPIYQKINPYTTFNINLSSFKDQLENNPPNIVLNKGMLLTSDKYVTAYYECANTSNPGIFSLKGKNALGTDFWIVSQNLYSNHDGKESFDIVATEDGTTVWITPSDTIVGHKAGVTFAVMLHKGQTWSARAVYTTAARMLGGSHVSSDKPIAVTWQDDSIITGGWDIVCDQTIPVNILGKEYITIKGFADNSPPGNNDERVFVLATQDNTTINVDGSYASTINTGEEYDYGIPSASNTAYISASAPVYVMHLSGHPGEAGASIIPHDSCTGSRVVGFNRSSTNAFALLILTRATNKDSFYLNGNNSLIPGSAFNTVPGTGGLWVYYRQNNLPQTTVPLGANLLENTMGNFHLGILNNVGASSEYGFFSNFSSLYLGADASICPGDSMELDAGPFMNSYAWYKRVSGSWLLLDTTRYFTVLDTGTYSCLVNGDFCTLSDTINISYYPLASVFIGNDTTLCQGQNITLDPGAYITYLWSTGSTSRWLNTSLAGTYWVRVTNNNGCSASDTVVIAVDSLPQAGHGIAGPDSVCSLQSGVLYSIDSLHFAQSYSWTLPPGVSGNSTTRQILLSFPAGSSSGILKVHGHNVCGDSPDTLLYITVKPRPGKAGSITGPVTVCQGQAGVSYSTPPVTDATGYAWSRYRGRRWHNYYHGRLRPGRCLGFCVGICHERLRSQRYILHPRNGKPLSPTSRHPYRSDDRVPGTVGGSVFGPCYYRG